MDDLYATLRVRPNASRAELERAYRRLARAYHPDLLSGASPETRRRGEDRLKRVNAAYSVLGDPRRRAAYDRERTLQVARAAPRPAVPAAPRRPPPAETTIHWGAGGPIDIEWATPPPRAARPDTDVFSPRRLLRGAAAIVLFAALLALFWRPGGEPAVAPAPPTVTQSAPASAPTPGPSPTIR